MTTPEEGKEYVDVRKKWPREDLDFTRWLAEHLDVLSGAVGMKLELIQKERPVGPFYCDILARRVGSDVRVAIENQMELTDHSHLGQLLTYASGLGTQIAIWIAPEILHEHAAALDWLNKSTNGPKFYGVKVMVLKTGNTLEPRFYPVVTPCRWNKDLSLQPGKVDPRKQRFRDFFRTLVDGLRDIDFPDWVTQDFGPADRLFRSRPDSGIRYAASLEGNGYTWVTLQIRMGNKELTNTVFDKLFKHKGSVEKCIPGQDWQWYKHENNLFSSINIRRAGSIDDSPEKVEQTRAWMLEMLPRLKIVFDPHVASILTDLQGERGANPG